MQQQKIECLFELMVRKSGFTLIHDGQFEKGEAQFDTTPRFFTRKYRKVSNNKFTDEWVVFVYDVREMFCIDIRASKRDPDGVKHEQVMTAKCSAREIAQ